MFTFRSGLNNGVKKKFDKTQMISSIYRPYFKQVFYFDKHFNGMSYLWHTIYNPLNYYITIPGISSPKDFHSLASKHIIDLNCLPAGCQCLPIYCYDKSNNRIDNITDWGLKQFHNHYTDPTITKENIFHYVYAVLHNPTYRTKYELNLKRDFPRIPFYEEFAKWAAWGKQLMDLHINYETVEPFDLKEFTAKDTENPKPKLKTDKEAGIIVLDEATTLTGIPAEAWQYKLGNRSALEWILDQYKEKKPTDPTIAEQFNTYRLTDYKIQVIDLLRRVCTVSVETMKVINEMSVK